VAICRLKRVAADYKNPESDFLPEMPKRKTAKRSPSSVAVRPRSPWPATCCRSGYSVDLFDNQPKAGGFIRTQVPSFRLPEKVLNEEVDRILGMGVNAHFNHRHIASRPCSTWATTPSSSAPGRRAAAICPICRDAAKASGSISIGIEWLAGVLYRHVTRSGPRVLVLGGGNTAMDCCRTAKRLGAEEVTVVVRSPKNRDEGLALGDRGRPARGHPHR
jgi:formate dehydrogenase (NADP+) beta subunit